MIANPFAWLLWIAFGLSLGSFINVVIHRLPKSRSFVRPGSHCPRCRGQLAWFDNIPLLSYLILGGRCRRCRKPISLRYPAVEAVVGAAAALLLLRYPPGGLWVFTALWGVAGFIAVTMIDWDTFLIPNELSYGLLLVGLAAAPINPLFAGGPLRAYGASVLGAGVGFFLTWGIAVFGEFLFKREAMGGGDIKLMAAIGAWSGALGAFDCMVVGSFIGAVYGIALLVRKKVRRQDPIPFGPFLSAGAILNFFYVLPFGFPFN